MFNGGIVVSSRQEVDFDGSLFFSAYRIQHRVPLRKNLSWGISEISLAMVVPMRDILIDHYYGRPFWAGPFLGRWACTLLNEVIREWTSERVSMQPSSATSTPCFYLEFLPRSLIFMKVYSKTSNLLPQLCLIRAFFTPIEEN